MIWSPSIVFDSAVTNGVVPRASDEAAVNVPPAALPPVVSVAGGVTVTTSGDGAEAPV